MNGKIKGYLCGKRKRVDQYTEETTDKSCKYRRKYNSNSRCKNKSKCIHKGTWKKLLKESTFQANKVKSVTTKKMKKTPVKSLTSKNTRKRPHFKSMTVPKNKTVPRSMTVPKKKTVPRSRRGSWRPPKTELDLKKYFVKIRDLLHVIEMKMIDQKYGKWDNIKKVPKKFHDDVRKAEQYLRKITGPSEGMYAGKVNTLSKLYPGIDVHVPKKTRFLLRRSGKNHEKYDFDACKDCNFHKLTSGQYMCAVPSKKSIKSMIADTPKQKKFLYLPIRLFRASQDGGCAKAFRSFHANALLIDMTEHTFSVYDANGITKDLGDFYESYFGPIADQIGYSYKRKDKRSIGFSHGNLCGYAVFLTAFKLDIGIKRFMRYVVKSLHYQLMDASSAASWF